MQTTRRGLTGLAAAAAVGLLDWRRVAAQGIALQTALQTIRKKPHRCERGHGQGDGHDQQAQLTGAQVTPERAPTQGPGGNRHPPDLT